MSRWDHHPPCPGGCGELADECMTPGCGSPLGSMRIVAPAASDMTPRARDARNLRRRAHNHGRSVADQVHIEALRMMRTHRPAAVVAHLSLGVEAAS